MYVAKARADRLAALIAEYGSREAYEAAKQRRRAERHRAKVAAWAAANPDKIREKRDREERLRRAEERARQREILLAGGRGSLVYFVRDGTDGPIKIGWTAQDVADRLKSLQCGNPRTLVVIGVVYGKIAFDETELHRRFDAERINPNLEWFHPSERLLAYIAEHAKPWSDEQETQRSGE